jgi:endonuclease YncB( thermonuclease family)
MELRESLINLAITVALVCVVAVLALMLKGERAPVQAAIPISIAQPVDSGAPPTSTMPQHAVVERYEIFVNPKLVPSPKNEADTLRFRIGQEELIFDLYFVDALDMAQTHKERVKEQAKYFGNTTVELVNATGKEAYQYVSQLLQTHPVRLLTRWERAKLSNNYLALIMVELQKDKWVYLADLIVRNGFGSASGKPCELPNSEGKSLANYTTELRENLKYARERKLGIWSKAVVQ